MLPFCPNRAEEKLRSGQQVQASKANKLNRDVLPVVRRAFVPGGKGEEDEGDVG